MLLIKTFRVIAITFFVVAIILAITLMVMAITKEGVSNTRRIIAMSGATAGFAGSLFGIFFVLAWTRRTLNK